MIVSVEYQGELKQEVVAVITTVASRLQMELTRGRQWKPANPWQVWIQGWASGWRGEGLVWKTYW